MVRARVNATRLYVLVDDPSRGRSIIEVLGSVTVSREFDFDGTSESATITLEGDVIRQVIWDGRSPIPQEQPALEEPRAAITP